MSIPVIFKGLYGFDTGRTGLVYLALMWVLSVCRFRRMLTGLAQNRDDVVLLGQLLSRAPVPEERGDSGSGSAVVCGDAGRNTFCRWVLYLCVDM